MRPPLVYLSELQYIEFDLLLYGVSVQDYQVPWDLRVGMNSIISFAGMDSAGPGWAVSISPSCWMLGWLRRRGCRWLLLVLFTLGFICCGFIWV